MGVIKGDTRSLDYSSFLEMSAGLPRCSWGWSFSHSLIVQHGGMDLSSGHYVTSSSFHFLVHSFNPQQILGLGVYSYWPLVCMFAP